jgi:CDP-diglyceride synthetase
MNKISPKVTVSASVGAVTAFVLWVLGVYVFHGDVPAPVSGLAVLVVPGLAAGISGWWVRDVERKPAATAPPEQEKTT